MAKPEDQRIWNIMGNQLKPVAAIAVALATVGVILCKYPSNAAINDAAPETPAATTSVQQQPALYP